MESQIINLTTQACSINPEVSKDAYSYRKKWTKKKSMIGNIDSEVQKEQTRHLCNSLLTGMKNAHLADRVCVFVCMCVCKRGETVLKSFYFACCRNTSQSLQSSLLGYEEPEKSPNCLDTLFKKKNKKKQWLKKLTQHTCRWEEQQFVTEHVQPLLRFLTIKAPGLKVS